MKPGQIAKSMEIESQTYPKMFAYIRETYGAKNIDKARKYLCHECVHTGCSFLPITTNGEECPYAPRGNKKGTVFTPV